MSAILKQTFLVLLGIPTLIDLNRSFFCLAVSYRKAFDIQKANGKTIRVLYTFLERACSIKSFDLILLLHHILLVKPRYPNLKLSVWISISYEIQIIVVGSIIHYA